MKDFRVDLLLSSLSILLPLKKQIRYVPIHGPPYRWAPAYKTLLFTREDGRDMLQTLLFTRDPACPSMERHRICFFDCFHAIRREILEVFW